MWQWRRTNADTAVAIIILWSSYSVALAMHFSQTADGHQSPLLVTAVSNGQRIRSTPPENVTIPRLELELLCFNGCTCSDTSIECINVGWTSVPRLTLSRDSGFVIHAFVLSGNNVTSLGDAFVEITDLETLTLRNNSIKWLEPLSFRNLTKLTTLDLSRNQLRAISVTTLESLNNLVHLDLSHNLFRWLANDSFTTLVHLQTLDLSSNSINFLASNTFQGLANLHKLDLSSNDVSVLQSDMFCGLHRLSMLSLEGNSIASIEAKTFRHVANVSVLVLSQNVISHIDPAAFEGLQRLTHLMLSHNNCSQIPAQFTQAMPALVHLSLAANPIVLISQSQFSPGRSLTSVDLSGMPSLTAVSHFAFSDLPSLMKVILSHCPLMRHLNPNAFHGCSSMEELDLTGSGLKTLHGGIMNDMPKLRHLSLSGNQWHCDCSLKWLATINELRPGLLAQTTGVKCVSPPQSVNRNVYDDEIYHVNCSNASVIHYSPMVNFRIGSSALLECQVSGDPSPAITWLTPRNHILHWYPETEDGQVDVAQMAHPSIHDSDGVAIQPPHHLQVLSNGNLFISPVETADAGIYTCMADNSLGNHSVSMALTLDYEIIMHVKIVSILVGLATSVAFLLTMLVAQLVHMILNRWGWCCCRGKLPPKAKKIRKMLESIEHYKTQQLERLRENYNMQVQRIKDNGTQQMEWLRDSYSSQTERLKDIRDYGTLQIDRMRDQYYEQVRRVRDYSVQQMSRVRENYVCQRNRIRKFSAHQLFKLRENYKIQQMHLNKILENLNLESCRTVCARTDSVMFTSEITMDPCFVSGIQITPIPLDGTPSSGDSIDFNLTDMEVGNMMLPPELEEFEMRHYPLTPGSGDDDSSEGYETPMSLPVFPLDEDPGVEQQQECDVEIAKGGGGGVEHDQEEAKKEELEEIVTYIVDPASSPKITPQKETNVVNV